MAENGEREMPVRELIEKTGIPKRTLYSWIQNGELEISTPLHRGSTAVGAMIRLESLAALLEKKAAREEDRAARRADELRGLAQRVRGLETGK